MRLNVDIPNGPPTAAQIHMARRAILRQLITVVLVFPISIAGIAMSASICTAPAYIAVLIASVMYLLYLTNDGQWLLFGYVTPQQATMLAAWEASNAAIAKYCAQMRQQDRAPTDCEYRALLRFMQSEQKSG